MNISGYDIIKAPARIGIETDKVYNLVRFKNKEIKNEIQKKLKSYETIFTKQDFLKVRNK